MLSPEKRREWIKSRRDQRKAARQIHGRRQSVRMVLLLAVITTCIASFIYLPWCMNDIDTDIKVRGNIYVSTDQIKSLLAESLHKPIFQVDPSKLEKKIASLEGVKHVFVKRAAFPKPQLSVEVLEEFPWATLSSGPEGVNEAVIAESGRVIPLSKFPNFPQPKLKIYGPSNIKMMPAAVKQWATWISYIEKQVSQSVTAIDLRKPFDVAVETDHLDLKLGTLDNTVTERLGRLISIIDVLNTYKGKLQHVDLALDNNIPLKMHSAAQLKAMEEAAKRLAEREKKLAGKVAEEEGEDEAVEEI